MKRFIDYLENRIAEGKAEIIALESAGRKDDANFTRIRTNIYDVCMTVSLTLAYRPGAGISAVGTQLERFRTQWGAALEKARQHENINAAAVEETKLAVLQEIIASFQEETGA